MWWPRPPWIAITLSTCKFGSSSSSFTCKLGRKVALRYLRLLYVHMHNTEITLLHVRPALKLAWHRGPDTTIAIRVEASSQHFILLRWTRAR